MAQFMDNSDSNKDNQSSDSDDVEEEETITPAPFATGIQKTPDKKKKNKNKKKNKRNTEALPMQLATPQYKPASQKTPHDDRVRKTWLDEAQEFEIDGFDHIRADRRDRIEGGVATFVANGTPFRKIDLPPSTLEVVAVEVLADGKSISICNIYHSIQVNDVQAFENILKDIPPDSTPLPRYKIKGTLSRYPSLLEETAGVQ
ncbi:hypothetical protein DAPPUDRAFT_265871 [Daphnia pulex]|uniref:Uncharacterized protein n=1 Tax=Daphnia pulex TaxID=6669 RepID=E9HU59_DAPPU|nr:hypothetical protein DAPPUDRAFT_265871 [Daphnia pulex]|eukprot:EFX64726.1 hypothetical protein DAPPUDRAFT_265871 [Daphnia pulex]